MSEPVFARLFDDAERARWRMEDVPWASLDRAAVTPDLVQLVRDIAASEATTFSATQRFLADFADDVDFTSWLAVWFYEETKHPQVLMRWLAQLGEHCDDDAIRRARVTAPFMKSRMGTLVTNIISEVVASSRYMNLSRNSPEPVLAGIAARLGADEARHAASFFTFARKRLAAASDATTERRDALKVVYLWANETERVQHPVSMFRGGEAGLKAVKSRVIRMIGLLIGAQLRSVEDIVGLLKEA
jgi:hypothetical protein